MYEIRKVKVSVPNDSITGYDASIKEGDTAIEAIAGADGIDEDAATFISLIANRGDISITVTKNEDTGEADGIGITVYGEDGRLVLIRSLAFLLESVVDQSVEANS